MAGTSDSKPVRLWDLQHPEEMPRLLSNPGGISVEVLAFDPKGRWLAGGGSSGVAVLWDLRHSDSSARMLPTKTAGNIVSLAFDSKGRWLAATGDGTWLWDLENIEAKSPLPSDAAGNHDVIAFDADGSWFAAGGENNTVHLWDLQNSKLHLLSGKALEAEFDMQAASNIEILAFDPKGIWLAAVSKADMRGSGTVLFLWDLRHLESPPRKLYSEKYGFDFSTLAFDAQGRWLVAASEPNIRGTYGDAYLWDMSAPYAEPRVLTGDYGGIHSLTFDSLGHWLATVSEDGVTRLFDLQQVETEPQMLRVEKAGSEAVLAFDSRGRWAAIGSENGGPSLWDLRHLETPPKRLHLQESTGTQILVFDGESRLLAGVSGEKNIRLWDLENEMDEPRRLSNESAVKVKALAFDPRGRWLAAGGDSAAAMLWDLQDSNPVPRILNNQRGYITTTLLP